MNRVQKKGVGLCHEIIACELIMRTECEKDECPCLSFDFVYLGGGGEDGD